jgi:steroid 5-alpha reductase family enzyme
VLVAIWSLRLGTYLVVDRLLRHVKARTAATATCGGADRARISVDFCFRLFQAQALLVVWFAVPMPLAATTRPASIEPLEIVGTVLFAVGLR